MKILFINNFKHVDYLNDTTFHGARSLYGENVVESSDAWYMYNDADPHKLTNNWGMGFTVTGKLPRVGAPITNIEEKIRDKYFDLIIYGSVHRDLSYWDAVKQTYNKNQIILIDGEDELTIREDIIDYGTYFKRELVEENSKLIPISFSIPKELIYDEPFELRRDKLHFLSRLTPGATGFHFNNEKEYYQDYRNSCFSLTKKKAGWDCMRHYEIAASGCAPVFFDLDELPALTMVHWDRKLLRECWNEFWRWRIDESYAKLRKDVLRHVKKDLTTESMFKYILNKL